MDKMKEIRLNEVINKGFVFKFEIPVEDCPDIERFVNKYIRLSIGGTYNLIGVLKKVTAISRKEKKTGEELINKHIIVETENIFQDDGEELRFPDKNQEFVDDFSILYMT